MSASYQTFQNAPAAAEACAGHIVTVLESALACQELATLAVSGGTALGGCLSAWGRRTCRGTAPTSSLSMSASSRLPTRPAISSWPMSISSCRAAFPQSSVHRAEGELDPQAAAQRYADDIRRFFGLNQGDLPRFDVVHRGMGPDAHTASLFPGDPLIEDRQGIAAATFAPQFRQWRVTLLPGVLVAAKHTVFLVTGDDKKEALRAVIKGEYDPMKYPAQIATRPARCRLVPRPGRRRPDRAVR